MKIILEIKIIFVFMLMLCNVFQNYYLQIIICLRIYARILSLILSVWGSKLARWLLLNRACIEWSVFCAGVGTCVRRVRSVLPKICSIRETSMCVRLKIWHVHKKKCFKYKRNDNIRVLFARILSCRSNAHYVLPPQV